MTLIRRCARPIKLFGITEIEGGFPHSEIRGSKVVRTSPRLIAAYHVLHRLSAPRHPPNTLKALDRSHYQRPPSCAYPEICGLGRGHTACAICGRDRKTICFEHIREHRGQADAHNWQLVVSNACEVRSPRTNAKKPNLRSINDRICFLFTMTDSTRSAHAPAYSVDPRTVMSRNARRRQSDRLVEPDGIEPTTSCLQSTRSPN
jgi:hypothetical protein